MSDTARVDVLGGPELARGSRALFDKIDEAAPEAFYGVAERVASTVRGTVPRRSGALAGSVTATLDGSEALAGMGGPRVPYAGWIEFGGGHGRPYIGTGRYLYPAALHVEPQLVAAGGKAADHEIGRMRWETPSQ